MADLYTNNLADLNAINKGLILPDAYFGQIASRCFMPRQNTTAAGFFKGVDAFRVFERGNSFRVGWYRGKQQNQQESAPTTGDATLAAAIYRPLAGSFVFPRLTGDATPVPHLNGTILWLDFDFATDFKPGEWFQSYTLQDSSSGVYWRQAQAQDHAIPNMTGNNGPSNGARPALTDPLVGGQFGEYSYPPVAVWAYTRLPSVAVVSDSHSETGTEGSRPPNYDQGIDVAAIGARFAYTSFAESSTQLAQYLAATKTIRNQLIEGHSHVYNGMGFNDAVAGGLSVDQVLANDVTFVSLYPTKKHLAGTIMPSTATTDGHNSLSTQTVSGNALKFREINTRRRKGVGGASLILDTADGVDPFRTGKIMVGRNPAAATLGKTVSFTGSIPANSDVLTVAGAPTGGAIEPGDPIIDSITGSPTPALCGAEIDAQLTGTTGGAGTYRITRKQVSAVASRTMYVAGLIAPDTIHQTAPSAELARVRCLDAQVAQIRR